MLNRVIIVLGTSFLVRVRDWVKRLIRGEGREFYRRRDFLTHSRPATAKGKCQKNCWICLGEFKSQTTESDMEGQLILRFDLELHDAIQVA